MRLDRSTWRRVALAGILLLGAVACSGGDDGGGDGATLGSTEAPAAATVPAVPAVTEAGTGVVVVGGTTSSFAVTACNLEPNLAEPEGARTLASLEGAGTTGSGVAFTVEVQRFATGTDVVTYTDTVTYTDAARILQAQRIEVRGQVTDLRDPKAATALVRTRDDGLSAAGLAGAPGARPEDEGIIGLALQATCA
jgi:hypothetical protein